MTEQRQDVSGRITVLLGLFVVIVVWMIIQSRPTTRAIEPQGMADSAMTVPAATVAQDISAVAAPGVAEVIARVNLPDSYSLEASFGDLGPKLLAAGAIDYSLFKELYASSGEPLTAAQEIILKDGGDFPIVFDAHSSHFLLNFFWALGLTNQNPILEEGPMMQRGAQDIGRFASTGGWTIGQRPGAELYASAPIISLTPEQQLRLEEVVYRVYRPCCDNHTAFADCNHGMAMLGLLELLASQDKSVEEMFQAAKNVNAFWFASQMREIAIFFKISKNLDYDQIDPRMVVSSPVFSRTGFGLIHQWLVSNGLLEEGPDSTGSCTAS